MKKTIYFFAAIMLVLATMQARAQTTAQLDVSFGAERVGPGYREFDILVMAGPNYVTNNNVYGVNTTNQNGSWTSLNIRITQEGTFTAGDFTVTYPTAGISGPAVSNINGGGCYPGEPAFNLSLSRSNPAPDAGTTPVVVATVRVPDTHAGEGLFLRSTTTQVCSGRESFWSNSNLSNGSTRLRVGEDNNGTFVVLPVTLASFTAVMENSVTQLAWATTQELNSDRFEVEHSINARDWAMIGAVATHKNSTAAQTYSFTHDRPAAGINYYRLKMVDQDRTFAYSSIRKAELAGNKITAAVYPNPAAAAIRFDGLDAEAVKKIQILNASGIKVYQASALSSTGINIEKLPQGLYLVTIDLKNGSTQTQKMLIAR